MRGLTAEEAYWLEVATGDDIAIDIPDDAVAVHETLVRDGRLRTWLQDVPDEGYDETRWWEITPAGREALRIHRTLRAMGAS